MTLDLLPETYAAVRLDAGAALPAWADVAGGPVAGLVSVTRTPAELSIVCADSRVPAGPAAQRGFRALAVRGPLAFDQIGVLLALLRPLAGAGIAILAVSTYDTDYVLVPGSALTRATAALEAAGHAVESAP